MMPLKDRVRKCMEVAKENLLKDGHVSGAVLFTKGNLPDLALPLDLSDHQAKEQCQDMVQQFILKMKPDQAFLISDVWMKSVAVEDFNRDDYKPGDIEKSPDRIEAIVVVGGSVSGYWSAIQPYHHEDGQIVFDKEIEGKECMSMETAFFGRAWEMLAKEKGVLGTIH